VTGQRDGDFPALVGVACHDLRTPLAALYGFARTLERMGGLDARQERFLGMVVGGAEDLIRLIDDLALLTRVERDTLRASPQPVDLRELVTASAGEATRRLGEGRRVLGPGSGPAVRLELDPELATSGLAALAEKALAFQPEATEVRLALDGAALRLGPLSQDAARLLLDEHRDLHVAAAHAALRGAGATVAAAGDGLTIAFAT
jgi:signal transduction histidine kinase